MSKKEKICKWKITLPKLNFTSVACKISFKNSIGILECLESDLRLRRIKIVYPGAEIEVYNEEKEARREIAEAEAKLAETELEAQKLKDEEAMLEYAGVVSGDKNSSHSNG